MKHFLFARASVLACSALMGGSLVSTATLADSFQGSVWSLSSNGVDLGGSPGTQTFEVALSVNTNAYTGGGSFLEAVALKVSSALSGAVLVSAPGGVSHWAAQPGGLNASGCDGAGSGFVCASANSVGEGASVPGIYSWIFDLTMATGGLFTGVGQTSVKGEFVDAQGAKVGALVSEPATLMLTTPEPEALALVLTGSGFLGLVGFIGRVRKQRAATGMALA